MSCALDLKQEKYNLFLLIKSNKTSEVIQYFES